MTSKRVDTLLGYVFFFIYLGFTSLPVRAGDIWLSPAEIAQLPTYGPAWINALNRAQYDTSNPDLADKNDKTDTRTVAKALIYARTGDPTYANEVLHTLQRLVELHPIARSLDWKSLGAVRSMGSYAIAADLIDLQNYAPEFDQHTFRPWLAEARYADTEGGRGSIASLQERRPNNWGAHAGASRVAASLYLGDKQDVERAALVLRGHLGDRTAYSGFKYGDDLSWQADPSSPVGINPRGTSIDGMNLDGAIPDDARRCGAYSTSPCKTNYMWEGLQGLVVAAEMLHRAGYPAYEWSDRALLRAFEWLHNTTFADGRHYPAEGDDIWQVFIINKRYGTNFPTRTSSTVSPGKMIGYTDWTHRVEFDGEGLPETQPEVEPEIGPEPMSLLSSKFWSTTGSLQVTLEHATPGATIWVTDDSGIAVSYGVAPADGFLFKSKRQFYTQSGSCSYVVTDGSMQIAFEVSGSFKHGCAKR